MPGIGLIIDPLRTNYAPNPSGGTTKKFSDGTDFVTTRVASGTGGIASYDGTWHDKHAYDGAGAVSAMGLLIGGAALPLKEAEPFCVSVYVWIPAAFNGGGVRVDASSFTAAISEVQTQADMALRDQWQRIWVVETPGADVSGNFNLDVTGAMPTSTATGTIYSDAVMAEAGSAPTPYFPTATQIASGYAAWTGTPDNSISQIGEGVPTGIGASQLDLNDGIKFRAMKASYPTPPRKVNWASSADTEGALPASLQYENRQITIECRVYGSSASDLQTQLGYLEQKVGKINETEGVGGTHEYVSPSGATCVFDLLEASADYELDNAALANKRVVVSITFTAKPFWRAGIANEVAGVDHPETTKPVIIGLDTVNGGDVPAIARLVVDDDQGVDQWSLLWGLQSRSYSASPDAELFYEAETRTLQGGSELKVLAGASGSGSNAIFNGLLFPTFQPILSTQQVGGGNHFSHVGTYRVYARLYRPTTNNGEVTVAFQWAQGDFQQSTLNAEKHWAQNEFEGNFTFTDLGLVNIDKATAGTQRWEGHVLAKSTQPGDDIYIDCLFLFPVDEGFGTLQTEPTVASLTTVAAHDEFDQTAGNLDLPKVLPVGGSWSEAGKVGVEGFTVNSTFKWAQRTAVSDSGTPGGTFAIAGATTSPFASVSALLGATTLVYLESQQGLFLRYTNTSNWLMAVIEGQPPFNKIVVSVYKMVAGVGASMEGLGDVLEGISSFNQLQLTLSAFPSGRYRVECNGHVLNAYDPDLATGGALTTGKAGMYDKWSSSKACTRSFDNFQLLTGIPDAAVYASRSAEIRSDSVQRYDATGTVLSRRTDYKGAYVLMPPARREARQVRTIVKLSRGEIDSLPDSAIDDASFRIYWQPRGLVLPEN